MKSVTIRIEVTAATWDEAVGLISEVAHDVTDMPSMPKRWAPGLDQGEPYRVTHGGPNGLRGVFEVRHDAGEDA